MTERQERLARVDLATAGGTTVVSVIGEHDLSTAPQLRQELVELDSQRLVVLDFAQCTFIDSTVLGVLASASRRLAQRGGRLIGTQAKGIVRNALRVTGMADLLLEVDATALLDGRERVD